MDFVFCAVPPGVRFLSFPCGAVFSFPGSPCFGPEAVVSASVFEHTRIIWAVRGAGLAPFMGVLEIEDGLPAL